jgi:hypothetical protein
MAQTERPFSGLTINQFAELASLRTAINSGNTIFAADINRIATLINEMNGHYHTTTADAYQIPTYGNTGDRTEYYENKNTSTPDAVISAPTDTTSNTTITASRHNALANALNELRSHYHEINDRTAI